MDDIDVEEFLSASEDIAKHMADSGIPLPPSMPEAMTAMILTFADIRKSDCQCDACQRIRQITQIFDGL